MITQLNNKALQEFDCGTHVMVTDGPALGGCGRGEVGDPNTWIPELWRDVIDKYGVSSVLDVGCGYGYSTRWFGERVNALGIEGSAAIVEQRVCPAVHQWDFRDGRPGPGVVDDEFDLCWCSEFLEHVKAEYEPCYMAAFVKCKYLLITAAKPGFNGHHHVNEQPSEYWIERFRRYGFEFDQDETNRLRHLAHDVNPGSYFQGNGLFFRRFKEVSIPKHWTEAEGHLSHSEAEKLQELARGRRVLMIGGDGKVALAIAQTAKQVTAINVPIDDMGYLIHDVKDAGFAGKVEVTAEGVDSEEIAARRFEMVVMCEGRVGNDLAPGVLLPGGHLVWMTWDEESTREFVSEATGIAVNHVRWLGSIGYLETAKWQTIVTLPHSRGVELNSYKTLRTASIGRFTSVVAEMDMNCGHLCHNFNSLLTQCIQWRDDGKGTHMFMVHSDIEAERGCADLLAEEMHLYNLIAISGVIAIKDPDQDRTSTAIGSKSEPWEAKRYIHRRQYGKMPTTFTGADVCENDDEVLLINTGLMLIDLRHPFWDEFAFNAPATILKKEGKRIPIFRPEDWEMSRELDRAGLRYGATWRPYAQHIGATTWDNRPMTVQVVNNG